MKRLISLVVAVCMALGLAVALPEYINSEGTIITASAEMLENNEYNMLDAEQTSKCMDLTLNVTYQQSSARKMLGMVNEFRQSDEAWFWSEDNSKKEYQKNLQKLKYDYKLEQVAMLRAAELIACYDHQRPNGEMCYTAYPEAFGRACGECIAVGDGSFALPEDVFDAWKESYSDYSGQPHRRIMLRPHYKSIGIAHVKYNGLNYWVLEVSSNIVDTNYKAPNDKNTNTTISVLKSIIEKDVTSLSKTSVNICDGKQVSLPTIKRKIRTSEQWGFSEDITLSADAKWSIRSGKDIVRISGGKIIPLKLGTAVLNAAANGKTFSVKVSVGHKWSKWKTTSFNFAKKTSTQTRKCSYCGKTAKRTNVNAINRLAGANRYDTAALISQGEYKNGTDTVIVATGLDFHDAMVAVPLASAYNAPLLLTTDKQVTKQTEAELARLKAKKVIIVSTNGAVGSKVKAALAKYNPTMISGKNCFETASKVATALQKNVGKAPDTIFFATDSAFADALSASPVAAIKNAPIIYLKKTGSIDTATANYLKSVKGKVKNAYIIGGDGVISDAMMKNVAKALGLTVNKTVQRLWGANRYETCVAVNNKFAGLLTGKGICVAKGLDFPDALAGGVYAAKTKQALFLADGKKLQDVQGTYLKGKNASKITVFGGTGAVPDELVKLIAQASV